MTISPWILLGMKKFEINSVEKIKTHFMKNTFFFPRKSCRLWDVKKRGRAREAIDDNMAHALCMLDKATREHHIRTSTCTHIHTEIHLLTLIAIPRQQWFRERASLLRYTYTETLAYGYDGLAPSSNRFHTDEGSISIVKWFSANSTSDSESVRRSYANYLDTRCNY